MEEKYSINGINYRFYGEGQNALLLHGWGQNMSSMLPIAQLLKGYRCLIVDLPGFGDSEIPKYLLTINDYALIINRLCIALKFQPFMIIGHSFGGKVAYAYALNHKVNYLVLTGPSIIKPKKTIAQYLRIYIYKFLKKINNKIKNRHIYKILSKFGSNDYKATHGVMRRIMVCSVNTYYDDTFEDYKGKILLVYGSNDKTTPLKEGKKIVKKLQKGTLKVISKGDHFAYLDKRYSFIRYINEFIVGEK